MTIDEAKAIVLSRYPAAVVESDYHEGVRDTYFGRVVLILGQGTGTAKSFAMKQLLAEGNAWVNAAERIQAAREEPK